jgi:hypothetical protein
VNRQSLNIRAIVDSYDIEPVHVSIKIGWRCPSWLKVNLNIGIVICEFLRSLCNDDLASSPVPDATRIEKTASADADITLAATPPFTLPKFTVACCI